MFFELLPLLLIISYMVVIFLKPMQNLLKSLILSIIISTIASLAFNYVFPYLPYAFDVVIVPIAICFIIGLGIAVMVSVYNILKITGQLLFKHGQTKKSDHRKIMVYSIVLLLGIVLFIPNFTSMNNSPSQAGTKSYMHTLQLSLEDFSCKVKGYYPSHLNTRVLDVLKDFNVISNDSSSVTGYSNSDTIFAKDIGTTGPSLLPTKGTFKNVWGISKPVLIFSKTDPPVWDKNCIGVIYYVPIDVKGNTSKSYKIYGAGKKGLFPMTLEPGDMPKNN